jgi:hypothetical protein
MKIKMMVDDLPSRVFGGPFCSESFSNVEDSDDISSLKWSFRGLYEDRDADIV